MPKAWVTKGDYIGGDIDRPFVTGRVFNQDKLPPWRLPQQQALSGFRSRGQKHCPLNKDERALWATFQAVVQISQLANWAPAPTKTSDPARSSAPSDAQPGTSPQRTE